MLPVRPPQLGRESRFDSVPPVRTRPHQRTQTESEARYVTRMLRASPCRCRPGSIRNRFPPPGRRFARVPLPGRVSVFSFLLLFFFFLRRHPSVSRRMRSPTAVDLVVEGKQLRFLLPEGGEPGRSGDRSGRNPRIPIDLFRSGKAEEIGDERESALLLLPRQLLLLEGRPDLRRAVEVAVLVRGV